MLLEKSLKRVAKKADSSNRSFFLLLIAHMDIKRSLIIPGKLMYSLMITLSIVRVPGTD